MKPANSKRTIPRLRERRRAALLLEVLVALTILVAVLGVLSGQLVGGLKMVAGGEEQTRASQLADRIMSLLELDPTTMQRVFVDQQSDGEFGEDYPGWYWRVFVEPTTTAGLGHVTVEVLHQSDPSRKGDIDNARVVRQLHMLKADPGRIDLEKDFGVEQEIAEAVMGQIPIPGLNPTALDPQQIVGLDPAELMQLLPTLLPLLQQFGGGGGGNLNDLLKMLGGGGDLAGLLGGAGGPGGEGGRGGADMLRNLIQQQLGDRVSDADLDRIFGAIGGSPGGGRRGGSDGDDGGDGPPPPPGPGGMSRDQLRDMIKGALGDQVSDEELEAALDNVDNNRGNQSNGGGAPPPQFGPGMGGRRGDGGGNGGGRRGGQTIRDFSDRRNGGKRGG